MHEKDMNKLYWMSDNRRYILRTDNVGFVLEDRNVGRTDYPMWVANPSPDTAHVLYNFPELVPNYVKERVYKILKPFYESATPSPANDTA
jgi:hypothetical protein